MRNLYAGGEGNGTPLQYSCLEKSHGQRSLVGCSPWGRYESDTTEQLNFHFSLSCIGEGNGNPLQGSCLENPKDGEAWWAAVYGVAQSRTRLKRLSSSTYLGSSHGGTHTGGSAAVLNTSSAGGCLPHRKGVREGLAGGVLMGQA